MSSFGSSPNSTPEDPSDRKPNKPCRPSLDRCHGAEVERAAERQNDQPLSPRNEGGGSVGDCEFPLVRDFCHGTEVPGERNSAGQAGSQSHISPVRAAELHQICLLDLLAEGREVAGPVLVRTVPAPYDSSIQLLDFSELVATVGRLHFFGSGGGGPGVAPSRWARAFEAIDLSLDPQRDAVCRYSLADIAVAAVKAPSDDSFCGKVRSALVAFIEARTHLDRLAACSIPSRDPEVVGQLDQFLSSAILNAGMRLGASRRPS
jgi:hypothetical protein